MTYREALGRVRAAYPADKRAWDFAHVWIGFVARPLSFPFSAALMTLGVSANEATLATALVSGLSLAALASARPGCMAAGAWGFVLYGLLDCVDGNLARAAPPERPPRGKFFDQLVGNSYVLAYLALGLGLRGELGAVPAWHVVQEGVAATLGWRALAWGALATAAKFFSMSVRHEFWEVLGPSWESSKGPGAPSHPGRFYYVVYCSLAELQSHVILLPLCLYAGQGFWFLKVSARILCLEAVGLLALYVRRAWRMT